jgi:hypothetical protein
MQNALNSFFLQSAKEPEPAVVNTRNLVLTPQLTISLASKLDYSPFEAFTRPSVLEVNCQWELIALGGFDFTKDEWEEGKYVSCDHYRLEEDLFELPCSLQMAIESLRVTPTHDSNDLWAYICHTDQDDWDTAVTFGATLREVSMMRRIKGILEESSMERPMRLRKALQSIKENSPEEWDEELDRAAVKEAGRVA